MLFRSGIVTIYTATSEKAREIYRAISAFLSEISSASQLSPEERRQRIIAHAFRKYGTIRRMFPPRHRRPNGHVARLNRPCAIPANDSACQLRQAGFERLCFQLRFLGLTQSGGGAEAEVFDRINRIDRMSGNLVNLVDSVKRKSSDIRQPTSDNPLPTFDLRPSNI